VMSLHSGDTGCRELDFDTGAMVFNSCFLNGVIGGDRGK